jgi:hypothetical protein
MKMVLVVLLVIGLVWPVCIMNQGTGTIQCDTLDTPKINSTGLIANKTKSVILRFTIKVGTQTNEPTKFIKVNGIYVSESICKLYPLLCVEIPIYEPSKQPSAPKLVKTEAQCVQAKERDWALYCWQNAKTISCDGVSAVDKAYVLANMAEGYYSNQAMCLRGEI